MKKVLIITYYWPPAGGPGVQRILKFVKYLPEYGWQPVVLTVKHGEYPAIDHSLIQNIPDQCAVYKSFSLEPTKFYKKFIGMKPADHIPVAVLSTPVKNWKKQLSKWIRLCLFIPDAKIGWKLFAVHEGKKIIKKEKPCVILSSSPPPTVHLIAMKLSQWSGIKWIADFRDPWTRIYHYNNIKRPYHNLFIDKRLESHVLKTADQIITVNHYVANLLDAKNVTGKKLNIIPNGFDEKIFNSLKRMTKFDQFTIVYTGKMNHLQNPTNLWRSIEGISNQHPEITKNLQILLIGNIAEDVKNNILSYNMNKKIKFLGYIPYIDTLKYMQKSHILLLTIVDTRENKGLLSAKLFEYMATYNFIMAFGPKDGEVNKILQETGTGKMFDYKEDVTETIITQYKERENKTRNNIDVKKIKEFSISNLTKKLADVLNQSLQTS